MFDPKTIREDFPILNRRVYDRPLVYLESGAPAQKPRGVIEKVDELHRTLHAHVHRGAHFLSEEITEQYEAAREEILSLIHI